MSGTAQLPGRVVVLASGTGSLLQALLDAADAPTYPAQVVAVGADRDEALALDRAAKADVPTFVVRMSDYKDRAAWDQALTAAVSAYTPDLVVMAGFMRLVGQAFLAEFAGRTLNTHPALLPAFPGPHPVRDALEHGVKVTGASIIFVDGGVDTGPIVAQVPVDVIPGDDEATLHERIKTVERALLVETVRRLVTEGWTISRRQVSIP